MLFNSTFFRFLFVQFSSFHQIVPEYQTTRTTYQLFKIKFLCYFLFRILFSVCNQFSRGVFSMLGAVSPESFDTLHSYSNTFQMPFVTPWFPEKVSSHVSKQPYTKQHFFLFLSQFDVCCYCYYCCCYLRMYTNSNWCQYQFS